MPRRAAIISCSSASMASSNSKRLRVDLEASLLDAISAEDILLATPAIPESWEKVKRHNELRMSR